MTGFLAWLLSLLEKLGLDFLASRGPPPVVVEAEKAGSATRALADVENADAKAQTAATAANDAGRAIATDDGLSKYEAADPNNRDSR